MVSAIGQPPVVAYGVSLLLLAFGLVRLAHGLVYLGHKVLGFLRDLREFRAGR